MTIANSSYIPVSLAGFSPESRIWLFGLSRPLSNDELHSVATLLNAFIDGWQSHGDDVRGTFAVIESQFVLVMSNSEVSGCSKDTLMRVMQQLEQKLGVNALDSLRIFYRNNAGEIAWARRAEFRDLVSNGTIETDAPVFDLSLTNFKQLHSGEFEVPLCDSVYKQLIEKIA